MSVHLPSAALALRERLAAAVAPELEEARRLDARKRAREILVFTSLWAAGAALGLAGLAAEGAAALALRVGGVLLAAVALNAYFLLTHEGHHHLLARSPRANRLLTLLLCAPLLHSPTAYRVLHARHHRHLGEEGDPDDYHNYSADPRVVWLLHWMRLSVGAILYVFLIPFIGLRAARGADRARILVDYAAMGACWAAAGLLVPFEVLAQVWLLPLVPVGYFTAVRGLAQHGLTDREDPYLMARSFRARPLVAFCLLNENLHLEHHLFPEVPSYHLPRLHAALAPHLPRAVLGTSYLRFLAQFVARSVRMDASPLGVTRLEGTG